MNIRYKVKFVSMKKVLFVVVTLLITLILVSSSFAIQQKVFLLSLIYDIPTEKISLEFIDVVYGKQYIPKVPDGENYTIKVIKGENITFSDTFTTTYVCVDCPPYQNYSIHLFIAHDPFAEKIEVWKGDGKVLAVELSVLCNNNGECDIPKESYLSCSSDCPSGSADGVCDLIEDGRCDPDCASGVDPDCLEPTTTISTVTTTSTTVPAESVICGNGVCEEDENSENCCEDCGCPEDEKCLQNRCIPDLCGNGFCEPKFDENYNTCKTDCPSGSKDNYCDGITDGRCDPDCGIEEDIDCMKPKDNTLTYLIILIVVIGLILAVIIRSRRE